MCSSLASQTYFNIALHAWGSRAVPSLIMNCVRVPTTKRESEQQCMRVAQRCVRKVQCRLAVGKIQNSALTYICTCTCRYEKSENGWALQRFYDTSPRPPSYASCVAMRTYTLRRRKRNTSLIR